MTNETYNLSSLSKEELQNIIESLLFSASTAICSDWFKQNTNISFELAKKLRTKFPEIITENIVLHEFKKGQPVDEYSKEILKYFPELKLKMYNDILPTTRMNVLKKL